jgi:transcription elongation GreA/GreB family factor
MKEKLIQYVKNYLDQRIENAKAAMEAAQESANNESKSSAGDKYETSRAMGHLDREMHGRMYLQAQQERQIVERLDGTVSFKKGALGAFMKTSMGDFFLSVSIGQVEIEGRKVMIISPQSPIGALLMGKMEGDSFSFRGKEAMVKEVE